MARVAVTWANTRRQTPGPLVYAAIPSFHTSLTNITIALRIPRLVESFMACLDSDEMLFATNTIRLALDIISRQEGTGRDY